MTNKIELLLREFDGQTELHPEQSMEQPPTNKPAKAGPSDESPQEPLQLDRSFASTYLDELIIAILCCREEANGMEIIRELTHRFGVQFSPGTVYPHLHSLEEEGTLACREAVQTKEYRIDDWHTARESLQSTVRQLSQLSAFLDASTQGIGPS